MTIVSKDTEEAVEPSSLQGAKCTVSSEELWKQFESRALMTGHPRGGSEERA